MIADVPIIYSAAAIPAADGQKISGLSAIDLFAAADRARAIGRDDDALALYTALSHDPDGDIRAEARFRQGMLLAELKRHAEAATSFRALLDEKPDATRARLELARVLAAIGDQAAARRALRQAQAAHLPPQVALAVDQFANALRSPKTLGGSLELALAPDSNINRATAARTLDTVIAPLTLSEDARARSDIGANIAAQVYSRVRLGEQLAVVPRLSGLGNFYRASAFNDVSASALLGLEWQAGGRQVVPSVGYTWRWYGPNLYARTQTFTIDAVQPLTRRSQLSIKASASRVRYVASALQNGALFDVRFVLEHALSARSGLGGSVGVTRQTAQDPGYATMAGEIATFGWLDIRRATLFASTSVRRTEGDARLFLFADRRREWLYRASGGVTLRSLTIHGFAPFTRITWERNQSTIGLYDYRRLSTGFGITRAF
jgi:tetratricopeptide (TPR) repeat protein